MVICWNPRREAEFHQAISYPKRFLWCLPTPRLRCCHPRISYHTLLNSTTHLPFPNPATHIPPFNLPPSYSHTTSQQRSAAAQAQPQFTFPLSIHPSPQPTSRSSSARKTVQQLPYGYDTIRFASLRYDPPKHFPSISAHIQIKLRCACIPDWKLCNKFSVRVRFDSIRFDMTPPALPRRPS